MTMLEKIARAISPDECSATPSDFPELTEPIRAAGTAFLIENADTGMGLDALAEGVYLAMRRAYRKGRLEAHGELAPCQPAERAKAIGPIQRHSRRQ